MCGFVLIMLNVRRRMQHMNVSHHFIRLPLLRTSGWITAELITWVKHFLSCCFLLPPILPRIHLLAKSSLTISRELHGLSIFYILVAWCLRCFMLFIFSVIVLPCRFVKFLMLIWISVVFSDYHTVLNHWQVYNEYTFMQFECMNECMHEQSDLF